MSFDTATGMYNRPFLSNVEKESKKSIDTSKSNTSQEADIYYQYILRVIIQKASQYDIFLPKNWCELNIPKLMDLLDLKSTTESNKTIEVNHI
ncbi:uncharacterized protein LOC112600312 isoform X2 [Melanaphis sacchari]|uniref:uncharacterized protein LOC112600312 isoform X2 n=1 Tax=Melanaphis sacchari TaxID=742174 RepID=UPI000DC13E34|nr:uncharacterized protein LOC112600312 isoform X2 [Melanaphis sacchari]